jgi:hypothetical protein
MLTWILGLSLAQAGEVEDLRKARLYRAGQWVTRASGVAVLAGGAMFVGGVAGPEPDRDGLVYGGLTAGLVGLYGVSFGPWLSGLAIRHDVPDHPTWPGQLGSTFGLPVFGAVQAGLNRQALEELGGPRSPEELDRRRDEWLDEELRYLEELELEQLEQDQGASWLEEAPQLGQPWAIRAVQRGLTAT